MVIIARDIVRTIGLLSLVRPAGLSVTLRICTTAGDEEILSINYLAFNVYSKTLGDGLPTARYFPFPGFEVN
jgi:hypothetical protein